MPDIARPDERRRRAGDNERRSDDHEEFVLDHMDGEKSAAERVDRRNERRDDRDPSEHERGDLERRDVRRTGRASLHRDRVRGGEGNHRRHDARLERPGAERRRRGQRVLERVGRHDGCRPDGAGEDDKDRLVNQAAAPIRGMHRAPAAVWRWQ